MTDDSVSTTTDVEDVLRDNRRRPRCREGHTSYTPGDLRPGAPVRTGTDDGPGAGVSRGGVSRVVGPANVVSTRTDETIHLTRRQSDAHLGRRRLPEGVLPQHAEELRDVCCL